MVERGMARGSAGTATGPRAQGASGVLHAFAVLHGAEGGGLLLILRALVAAMCVAMLTVGAQRPILQHLGSIREVGAEFESDA